jgi:hypothetical protein
VHRPVGFIVGGRGRTLSQGRLNTSETTVS